MKYKKILMIIGALDYCNGITTYAMNYYDYLISQGYKIDFAVHYDIDSEYKKKILADGNNVFYMGNYSIKEMLILKRKIRKLLETNHYDIVHCHILNLSYFYLSECKKAGIKCRIIHAHATKNSDNFFKNIRNSIFKYIGLKYSTQRFACSKLAGKYLYGNKKFYVIQNAIPYQKFKYNENYRKELKKKYKITTELCLGFVGRLTNQKNPMFLLKIANALTKKNKKYKLFIIGDGNMKEKIEKEIKSKNLEKEVYMIN